MAKIAQRQVVAEIVPNNESGVKGPKFDGYFAQVSGGEITANNEKVFDGGKDFPDVLCAPSEIGDVTLSRPYDPDQHQSRLKKLRRLVGRAFYDLNVFTLNCDLKEAANDRTYAKALLTGLTEPEGDASSGAPSTFTLTFSIGEVAQID